MYPHDDLTDRFEWRVVTGTEKIDKFQDEGWVYSAPNKYNAHIHYFRRKRPRSPSLGGADAMA